MYDYDMADSNEESMILEKMKRGRHSENENEENEEGEDRLSDLPDCIILHILSFLNTKHAVRTCVLSTKWKHLWKRIPTLKLQSLIFSPGKHFSLFVSKILTLRDSSTALHALDLDLFCHGGIEPQLLKKILNYVCSHNNHLQELGIRVSGDSNLIMNCVSSCRALTSLKLSIRSGGSFNFENLLFPKSLNLPALTNLDLTRFTFCGGENSLVEPFSAFIKLRSLVISGCNVRDAQTLRISSETLVNLTMLDDSTGVDKMELCAPSLCTFTYSGEPTEKICGSGLSSVKQVYIDARIYSTCEKPPMTLLSWLLDLANVKSLTVTSTTLQTLSLVPDLLEVKLLSLCNLKSMEIKLKLPEVQPGFLYILKEAMLEKAAAKSRKEAAKLRREFKAGLQPHPVPDGMVDFLLQNSPSAKVDITTVYNMSVC